MTFKNYFCGSYVNFVHNGTKYSLATSNPILHPPFRGHFPFFKKDLVVLARSHLEIQLVISFTCLTAH